MDRNGNSGKSPSQVYRITYYIITIILVILKS